MTQQQQITKWFVCGGRGSCHQIGTQCSQLQYGKTQFRCPARGATARQFCINKVKAMRTKHDHSFMLDNNSILRKRVRLRYTIEPTIVVPRKLTSFIIAEFHNVKGHQGINHTMNVIQCYFRWVGMHWDVHQHICNCQLCIQFLHNWLYTQHMHLEILKVPFTGCAMDCIGPLPASSKGNRNALTFICLLTLCLIMVPLKSKMADEVSMAYIKEILPKTSHFWDSKY